VLVCPIGGGAGRVGGTCEVAAPLCVTVSLSAAPGVCGVHLTSGLDAGWSSSWMHGLCHDTAGVIPSTHHQRGGVNAAGVTGAATALHVDSMRTARFDT
jgi:hypothetical protein